MNVESIQVMDCNCSYGRAARPPARFSATPAELLAELDFCSVDRALVFHANQRFAAPIAWNERLSADLTGQARLQATWAILPESCGEMPPPEALLDAMRTHGIRALRAFPQEHRYRLDGLACPRLFKLMALRRIPLFAKENLIALKELLCDCPDLRVVAVNQGPHSLDRHLRPLMDAFPNLHVETSGLLVEGLIKELCDRYGAGRLLFGSGYPDNCSGAARLCLAAADIGAPARAAIASETLDRLLREVDL